MLGAIAGDVLGSAYEANPQKSKRFDFHHPHAKFTDDTVMTLAVAQALESGTSLEDAMRHFGREYPQAGYGGQFSRWLRDPSKGPYGSWANGSAMRSAPAGWAARTEDEALALAGASAAPTHNHPEGIRGAQAVALAVFLARTGHPKPEIARRVSLFTGYNLNRRFRAVRRKYEFQIRCELSVPEALIAFLDSRNFDDAVRNAVALGGDSDTQACIAGAVAEAFYGGVPEETAAFVLARLSPRLLGTAVPFLNRFGLASSARQVRDRLEWVHAGA